MDDTPRLSGEFKQALKGFSVVPDSCQAAGVKWPSLINGLPKPDSSYHQCLALKCHDCKGVQAWQYLQGIGCPTDLTLALKLASESAAEGSKYGLITLAKILYDTDRIQAIRLCLRAARLGLGRACFYIGKELWKGTNVPRDVVEAHKWLQLAAAMEDPEGLCLLANCFLEGTGVPKNISTAIGLFERAQRTGYQFAEFALWLVHREASAQ
jgi:TPR repeat protein